MPFSLIPAIRILYLFGLEPLLFLNLTSQKLPESLLPTISPLGLLGHLLYYRPHTSHIRNITEGHFVLEIALGPHCLKLFTNC